MIGLKDAVQSLELSDLDFALYLEQSMKKSNRKRSLGISKHCSGVLKWFSM